MSRDAIFSRLRSARQAHSGPTDLFSNPTIPARACVRGDDAVANFVTRLEAQGVIVERLQSARDAPAAIGRFLKAARLPGRIRMGDDAILAALPWPDSPDLSPLRGAASREDLASLSVAVAGIAETGTLVLASGSANPGTLAFLPDVHFVMISCSQIVGSMEGAFDALKVHNGNGGWPRTVNFISGASRTGDIGGQLVMGAHGPRQLIVLLVAGHF